jgi:hypothetical protein
MLRSGAASATRGDRLPVVMRRTVAPVVLGVETRSFAGLSLVVGGGRQHVTEYLVQPATLRAAVPLAFSGSLAG